MTWEPFYYKGQKCRIKTILRYPENTFPDGRVPGDVKNLLGRLIETLNDAFAPPHAIVMAHIAVKTDDAWETVHLNLEYQINLRDPDSNGYIRLDKYAGPFGWKQEDWTKTTLVFTGLDLV